MQEQNQNMDPNQPELAELIRQNISHQQDLTFKRTLMKESILKLSLDKDMQRLSEAACGVPQKETKTNLQVTEEVREVCSWLEESQQFSALAYLPFESMSRLLHILHQKVEGTSIVITDYPTYWINIMQDLGRLTKLRWGVLTNNQEAEEKVQILQLYELKKLKLLFVTPNLFKCEEYHQFECDLLVIGDFHLYHNHKSLLDRIIAKTNPNRVLALHHTLMYEHYHQMVENLRMAEINTPKSALYNFLVLKTSKNQKFRTMMSFLSKGQYKRVLIVVNKRQQAIALTKKLMLESKTSINLFDYLSSAEMSNFTVEEKLQRIQFGKEEQNIFQLIKKVNNTQIMIAKNTDFLRFCNFDIAIYYSFTDVIKFVQSCFTTKEKLLLFQENDYHNFRNSITFQYMTFDYLQKVVMNLVEKPIKRQENSKKRFYSDCIQDSFFNCYTISKQYAQKDQEKVIKMNTFCKKNQISSKLLDKIVESLRNNSVIGVNYRTIYEIEIDLDSIALMKTKLPTIQEVRRKVNLLNVSTSLHKTVRNILDQLKHHGIKYKITQEAVQIKILKNYEDIDWQSLYATVNEPVSAQARNLDKSFQTFKECAYSSIELTRRQKVLQKKQILLDFFKHDNKEAAPSLMQSYHKSNLLTSQIQEWIRQKDELSITDHELVLLLQGVQKGKIGQFKQDPIYGRYRHLKYEELMQAVTRIYSQKKIKLE